MPAEARHQTVARKQELPANGLSRLVPWNSRQDRKDRTLLLYKKSDFGGRGRHGLFAAPPFTQRCIIYPHN